MSHYNVNASVAKTLIQHLIRFVAASGEVSAETVRVLRAILDTEISPELVPADAEGAIQSSEQVVGPYALQDFNLFYLTRYGYRPSKIAYLAHHAWGDAERGAWPADIPKHGRELTVSLKSANGWRCSCGASLPTSSNARRPRTDRKFPQEVRSRRAATGAPLRMRVRTSGSRNCSRTSPNSKAHIRSCPLGVLSKFRRIDLARMYLDQPERRAPSPPLTAPFRDLAPAPAGVFIFHAGKPPMRAAADGSVRKQTTDRAPAQQLAGDAAKNPFA